MLNFRPCSVEDPVEFQFDILDQIAAKFNVSDIRRMVLGSDVVVLHQSGGVEVGDKGLG